MFFFNIFFTPMEKIDCKGNPKYQLGLSYGKWSVCSRESDSLPPLDAETSCTVRSAKRLDLSQRADRNVYFLCPSAEPQKIPEDSSNKDKEAAHQRKWKEP